MHSLERRNVNGSEPMKHWIVLLSAAGWLQAQIHTGEITVSVVTNDGEPLSAAAVTLHPVAGSGVTSGTGKTDRIGTYTFTRVEPGAYLLTASRPNFLPAQYGQKRWNSAGTPVVLEANGALHLPITMHRYGAVTGRVIDENGVGIPSQQVMVFRDTRPPELVAKGGADDYGRYRIYGLLPGSYLVKSGSQRIDGADFVPTFAPGTQELMHARRVDVLIDLESSGFDLQPEQGRLYDVTAVLDSPPCEEPEITLSGEIGRQQKKGYAVKFDALPKGDYEIKANSLCDNPNAPLVGTYQKFTLTKDLTIGLPLSVVQRTFISYSVDGSYGPPRTGKLPLLGRTVDLAGTGDIKTLGNTPRDTLLAAGRWELLLQGEGGLAVVDVQTPQLAGGEIRPKPRPDAWNEVVSGGHLRGYVSYQISTSAGSVMGVVKNGNDPVLGAPVYLETYDPNERKRLTELRATITDAHGNYEFDGLAKGAYRVLSTFEYASPDTLTMDTCNATDITVERGKKLTQDLKLFVLQ